MDMNKKIPNIIEIKKDATENQIQLLKKMNPSSIILKENSEILKELYYLINCGIDIREITIDSEKNEVYDNFENLSYDYLDSLDKFFNGKIKNGCEVAA